MLGAPIRRGIGFAMPKPRPHHWAAKHQTLVEANRATSTPATLAWRDVGATRCQPTAMGGSWRQHSGTAWLDSQAVPTSPLAVRASRASAATALAAKAVAPAPSSAAAPFEGGGAAPYGPAPPRARAARDAETECIGAKEEEAVEDGGALCRPNLANSSAVAWKSAATTNSPPYCWMRQAICDHSDRFAAEVGPSLVMK